SLGVVLDNLSKPEEAEQSYLRAIELDPEYFEAIYNLGILHFNKGVEMNNAANDIKDNKKYEAEKERVKGVFRQALPYLEKAHNLNPDDREGIASLVQIYALLGETEKYTEMKARLESGN